MNTNREVADAALAPVFGEAETNALVERVDRAVYGPEPPSPEQVDDIERRIDQLQSSSDNPV